MGRRVGPLLIALGSILLWFSSRSTWVLALSQDDKSGTVESAILGSSWSIELMALTLVLLAGAVAGIALRRIARRVVAGICALAAAAAAWSPVSLLTYGPDPAKAQRVLQGAAANKTAVDTAHISEWAMVTSVEVSKLGPILAVIAAALALFGAVLFIMRPGADKPRSSKYETPASRQAKLAEELETSADSGRVMWEALDADIDPTDVSSSSADGAGESPTQHERRDKAE
ncbi:MAG: TIGR02234 family membrane protein [Corynebacterium flavescens]|uniref:TIGR02234 family membrane protein n=1 Tax=Corynebacterium flavescens TaxID=28028 RepID=UPI003F8EC52F